MNFDSHFFCPETFVTFAYIVISKKLDRLLIFAGVGASLIEKALMLRIIKFINKPAILFLVVAKSLVAAMGITGLTVNCAQGLVW